MKRTERCAIKFGVQGRSQAILGETKRAVTLFGGLAVLVEFWLELGVLEAVWERRSFAYRSPNAIGAAEILLSFWLSVSAGARRFSHVNLFCGDGALRLLLGWWRLPRNDATRAFVGRFGWKEMDVFFPALTVWPLERLPVRVATLDLDSTMFECCGRQEGAKKGYNPRRPGRLSHQPLLATLAEPDVYPAWLAQIGQHHRRTRRDRVPRRGDGLHSGGMVFARSAGRQRFFRRKVAGVFLGRKLPYVVVARLTGTLKRAAAGSCQWRKIDEHIEAGEFTAKLARW